MGQPVKAHEAQIAWMTLEAPWSAPPVTNPASVPPSASQKRKSAATARRPPRRRRYTATWARYTARELR
jgi:hypothetical protein